MDPSHTFPDGARCGWRNGEGAQCPGVAGHHPHEYTGRTIPGDAFPIAPSTDAQVLVELRELRADLAPVFRLLAQVQQVPRLAKALARTDV